MRPASRSASRKVEHRRCRCSVLRTPPCRCPCPRRAAAGSRYNRPASSRNDLRYMAIEASRLQVEGAKLDSLVAMNYLLARMAFERDARGMFGKPPAVGGRRVEIVHPVGNGIVDQRVDRLLVDRVPSLRRLERSASACSRIPAATPGRPSWGWSGKSSARSGRLPQRRVPPSGACSRKRRRRCGGTGTATFQELPAAYLFLLHFFRCG